MAIALCEECNKDFKTKIGNKANRFCSLKCYWQNMKGKTHGHKTTNGLAAWNKGLSLPNQSGERHFRWKGNSTEDYRERRRFRIVMQKRIFKRDNYQCGICGSNKDLQVDHIRSWADFRELRFDPENCRTLCTGCHYKVTFGKEMPITTQKWGHNFRKRQVP